MVPKLTSSLILICVMLLILPSVVSALEAVLEPMPPVLKNSGTGKEYQDEAFFATADPIITSLSNRTLPIGSQRMRVYSTYTGIRDMSISPENYDRARATLAFLYYTAKCSQAYEDYFDAKKSVSSLTDGSEFYRLAETYYEGVLSWWENIRGWYPRMTMYSLPNQRDPYPGDDSAIGITLEGLKYPLIIPQATPDPNRTFQDEKVKTTITRWLEDHIDSIPDPADLGEQSPGNYFLTSDGPRWAKSTYLDISTRNVAPEFYDTANYIDAFLYFTSLAHDYYGEYLDQRSSVIMAADGRIPYEKSRLYYEEAQKAFSLFRNGVPDIDVNTTLPAFPKFTEVEWGRVLEQEKLLSDYWSGTSWRPESSDDDTGGSTTIS